MAEKLSWTELRHAIAQRVGVSEKQAGAFLAAFQEQLTEGLRKDKLVKINGLGTFKLQAVAPRKSVNVSTGEEIIIEGYNKVVFVPEAGVKELVEKAGELGVTAAALHLTETKEVVDPLKKLGEQAEEIVDILGELGQAPKTKKKKKVEEVPEEVHEPETTETPEEPKEPEEPEVVEEPKEEPEVEEKPAEKPYIPEAPAEKSKKSFKFVRDTLICVVILLLLLLVGYFFLRNKLSGWMEEMVQPKAQTERVEEVQKVQDVQEVQEIPDTLETPEVQEPVVEETPVVEEPQEWQYDKLIKTEEIRPGSRLAWISKKYYGDKAYWPYLYAANKDHIDNPSNIPVGTPILVPKLTAADRDTTSVQFKQIKREAEEACRK